MNNTQVICNSKEIYNNMLNDIENATKSIYLETYIYSNDKVGREFRELLIKKAKQGIKVKVLIDALGAGLFRIHLHNLVGIQEKETWVNKEFFKELTNSGGEVRFFKEIRYIIRLFSANQERNHRKLLIIDNKISYIGSANITEETLKWRELVLRISGKISTNFMQLFNQHWDYSKLSKNKIKSYISSGYEILQDLPGSIHRLTERKYNKLIKKAKKEILIESPYFVPSFTIRRALIKAVKRGVIVKIVLPHRSDMSMMDIIRERYSGFLSRNGVQIYYYTQKMLHSKLLIVDDSFIIGSSNLNNRSFKHDFELNVLGNEKKVSNELRKFFLSGLKNSEKFSYKQWKNRSPIRKISTFFISLIERYL